MEEIELLSSLKKGIDKNKRDYYYISIMLTDSTEKRVFLQPAELELIKISNGLDD